MPAKKFQTQIIKNFIQNFDLLTASAFKIEKGDRVDIRRVQAKNHKIMAEPRSALKSAKKKGHSTVLERKKDDNTYRETLTGQGSHQNDIPRRDEEAKIDRVPCTNATEKATVGYHLFPEEKLWT